MSYFLIVSTTILSHQSSNGEIVGTVILCFRSIPLGLGTSLFDSTLTVESSDNAGNKTGMRIHYAILSSSAGGTSTIVIAHLSVGVKEYC
jgi:hypothetical protein